MRCSMLAAVLCASSVLLVVPCAAGTLVDPGGAVRAIEGDPMRNVFYVSLDTNEVVAISDAGVILTRAAVPGIAGWMAVSPDGSRLFVALKDRRAVAVYALPELSLTTTYLSSASLPNSGGLVAGNDRLYADYYDGVYPYHEVSIFDTMTGELLWSGRPSILTGIYAARPALSPDGETLYLMTAATVRVFDVSRDTLDYVGERCHWGTVTGQDIALSPDGQHVYVASPGPASLEVLSSTPLLHRLHAGLTGWRPNAIAVAESGLVVYVGDARELFTAVRTSDWLPFHVGWLQGVVGARGLALAGSQTTLAAAITYNASYDPTRIELVNVSDLPDNHGGIRLRPVDEIEAIPVAGAYTSQGRGTSGYIDVRQGRLGSGPLEPGHWEIEIKSATHSTETRSASVIAGHWTDLDDVTLTRTDAMPAPANVCVSPAALIGRTNALQVTGRGFIRGGGLEVSSSDPEITVDSFSYIDWATIELTATVDPFATPGLRWDVVTVTNPDGQTGAGNMVAAAVDYVGLFVSPSAGEVAEDGGSMSLTVVRYGNPHGAVSVDYASVDGTAIAGSDYSTVSGTLSWGEGQLGHRSITVPILSDDIAEMDETFQIVLSNPTGGAVLDVGTATVTILDDDRCELAFAAGAATVPEEAGSVELTVARTGPYTGPVSVSWNTAEGSARSGLDYAAGVGTLSWSDGDLSPKTVQVQILDDVLNEGSEWFTAALSDPGANVIIGAPGTVTVTIVDDERAEVQVNSTRDWSQTRPAVACDGFGRSVVAWDSDRQDGDGWSVIARRLDATGRPAGLELAVNTTTASHQKNVEVAAAPDGRFVVVWEGLGQDGNLSGVAGRLYGADGTPASGELALNATVAGDQQRPSVAMRPDGSFVAAWQSYGQDGSGWGVYARRFDAAGVPLGGELPVNVATAGDQSYPDVSALPAGGFAVAWQNRPTDGDTDVRLRLFNAAGVATTGEVTVNATTAGEQREASIAAGGDGTVWVAWEAGSDQDGSGYGVFARRFDAAGAPLTEEVQLNLYTAGDQSDVSLAIDRSTGRGTALWQSDGQDGAGLGVFARTLLTDGTWHDTEQAVNSTTVENQHSPAATRCGGGRFTLTWASYDQDNWYDAVIAIVGSDSDWVFGDGLEAACTDAWSGAAGVTP